MTFRVVNMIEKHLRITFMVLIIHLMDLCDS